jgi:hypothetical protein
MISDMFCIKFTGLFSSFEVCSATLVSAHKPSQAYSDMLVSRSRRWYDESNQSCLKSL